MCDDNTTQELLPAYLEKTLDPDGSIRVEQHLVSCEDCRTELALLRVIADDALPVPDDAFWSGMPDRIYREIQTVEQQEKRRFALTDILGWMFIPRLAWATAAVIAIAAVSWFMVRSVLVDVASTTLPASSTALEDSSAEPMDLAELSSEEFDAATQWAQNTYAPIEKAITSDSQEHTSLDISEELSELSPQELDRVYEMLNKKHQDAQEKLRKRTESEKRVGWTDHGKQITTDASGGLV